MDDVSWALTIISGMITPAVLILACGSLAISTSNRLARAMDRTRTLLALFKEHADSPPGSDFDEEHRLLFSQVDKAARRSRLLHRSLGALYLALGVFVATSVAIALIATTGRILAWLPISLGLIGAGLLLYTSILLILESRVGNRAIEQEMDFSLRLAQRHLSMENRPAGKTSRPPPASRPGGMP